MFRKASHIHFVGIGGSGMSGIAEVLINLGFNVSGSDTSESAAVKHLMKVGAKVFIGHAAQNVNGSDVVVTSTAINPDNVEVEEAKIKQVPIIRRAEMLAELMRLKHSIAVAGAHGKTTTTSLIATILNKADMDPTVVIGGRLNSLGSGAKLGTGEYIVAEADESDGSFLSLSPTIAVLTNIDFEHVDHYITMEAILNAFKNFVNKVPFYGKIILNIDDQHIQSILPDINKKYVTYGLSSNANISARDLCSKDGMQSFILKVNGESHGEVKVAMHGIHNVYNTLAAIATAVELGIDINVAEKALKTFEGIERRFQLKGEINGIKVYDDYGHHPAEIKLTLQGFKTLYPEKKLVVLFQPHRYTRTVHLEKEFETSFYDADIILLLDIYSAGEKAIEEVSSEKLTEGIRQYGHRHVEYLPQRAKVNERLNELLNKDCVLLTLGAGDVWKEGESFLHG
ncbi:MAG: UDP-N-acetylmuramate--L-alanine ligase [Nitrospinae bacterium]|nr:UDP-N-acetylmuramate--L-alanine ligase [Nitrospinota bacterium]